MAIKKKVYLNDRSESFLEDVLSQDGNLSGRIGTIIDRYAYMIGSARRYVLSSLSTEEMQRLKDGLGEWIARTDNASVVATELVNRFDDAVQFGELSAWAKTSQDDAKMLGQKIRSLQPEHLFALVEWIERKPLLR